MRESVNTFSPFLGQEQRKERKKGEQRRRTERKTKGGGAAAAGAGAGAQNSGAASGAACCWVILDARASRCVEAQGGRQTSITLAYVSIRVLTQAQDG